MSPQSVSLFLVVVIILAIGAVFLLRRKAPDNAGGIPMLIVIVAIWALAYLLHGINGTYIPLNILKSVNYLCSTVAALAQLFFALSYSHRTRWLTFTTFVIFLVEPILIQIFFWIEPSRAGLFSPETGMLDQVNLIYISCVLAVSIFLFMETFLSKPRPHFLGAWTILVGAIFPLLSSLMLFILRSDLDTHFIYSIFSYSLAVVGFSYGMFNGSLIEVTPLTRDVVIEGMDDGWMVVDHQDKVIDVNSSAEKIIGISREKVYGLPVNQILSEWTKVLQSSEGVKEMEMRRTSKSQSERQYLNLRISQLVDKNNLQFGHLVVWRDITGRKLIDAIHQSARDELFVLLNAISSLASRSINLEDFLSESSYQILYSFHSQAIAVFLTEENDSSQQKLSLKSHFGFSPEYINIINSKTIAANIYNWLIKNEENRPLILNAQDDFVAVPFHPTDIGFNYVTLIPLIIYTQHENSVQGSLCLGRNEDTVYSQDEVIRLTTIANQIATLIDSNRRRQFAIALSERQRLLRDLHDSVSQKLYGLVALTEAAQAGIEAGSKIAPVEVLSRIGENARQAVKEMRLFLYEMQPIDLKDGLVSSLQHRLASVEGRADIKARMISDENIQLEKDDEIALYYIAQEALNNILRHAHARNVSVNLKQTRQHVILEITDDGQGFDIKKLDNSGLGLRNMKERAVQANGKFRITSKPGMGTKIVVTVARKVSL
jgi:PAS domain S-box-containing protein